MQTTQDKALSMRNLLNPEQLERLAGTKKEPGDGSRNGGDKSFGDSIPQAGAQINDKKHKVRPISGGYAPVVEQKFAVMSAKELQKADLPPVRFIVDEILPQGLGLIAAPSKYGKSWAALDLCLSVAEGTPFLGFKTEKCGVLYLALEDSYRRLKTRMNAILKENPAPDFFNYVVTAPTLDNGLEYSLRTYIKEHPQVGLIVIDVLQKIRSATKGNNPYAAEYADMTILKRIADEFNIAIVVLHHNRKMRDEADPFNMISGTMALMGTSDTIWTMQRQKRTDEDTTLSITGRDVEMNSYKIKWDKNTYRQKMIGNFEAIQASTEEDEYYRDPIVITIKALLEESPTGFSKTASEFLLEVPKRAGVIFSGNEKSLGIHFNQLDPKLLHYSGIVRKKDRRMHRFYYNDINIVPFPVTRQMELAEDEKDGDNPFL